MRNSNTIFLSSLRVIWTARVSATPSSSANVVTEVSYFYSPTADFLSVSHTYFNFSIIKYLLSIRKKYVYSTVHVECCLQRNTDEPNDQEKEGYEKQ